jgi:hypothetical protein
MNIQIVFLFFKFFLFIHLKSKNVSGVNIWSFFLDHQTKKYIKKISLFNSSYLKSEQEFFNFSLIFLCKTFVVRGGSI